MNSLRVLYLLHLADRLFRRKKEFTYRRAVSMGNGRFLDLHTSATYMSKADMEKQGINLKDMSAFTPGDTAESWFEWAWDIVMQLWEDFDNKGLNEPVQYAQANLLIKDNPATSDDEARFLISRFSVDIR